MITTFDYLFAADHTPHRFPHYHGQNYTHFRVVGIHLPTRHEPATPREREAALAAYDTWIEQARAWCQEARNDWRLDWGRRCDEHLARLQFERQVWHDSVRFTRSGWLPSRRPFNCFAVAKNYGGQA